MHYITFLKSEKLWNSKAFLAPVGLEKVFADL